MLLLLATLIALSLFIICMSLIYNNRQLDSDSEMATTIDFAPNNSDIYTFSFPDAAWGKQYMATHGYHEQGKNAKYRVFIRKPFSSLLISIDTLLCMGNYADVIFTQNKDFVIMRNDITQSLDNIIQEELYKYSQRKLLPHGHLCNELSLQELCDIKHHKTMLQAGVPIRIGRMGILSDHSLYGDQQVYPRCKQNTVLAPKHIPAKLPGLPSRIPKIFHQTFESMVVAKQSAQCINAWILSNPDYEYRYYTGEDCRDFIAKHFSKRVLAAYDTVYAGAYKADLWRLCVLYVHGGVYGDVKLFPALPLYKIIDPSANLVLVTDLPSKHSKIGIYNAFMAASPKQSFVKRMIEATVRNIEDRRMTHFLDITGPIAIGREFEKYVQECNPNYDMSPGVHEINQDVTLQMLQLQSNMAIFDWCVTRGDKIPIIYRRYKQDGFFSGDRAYRVTSGKPHYHILFGSNMVYEKGVQ